MKRKGKVVLKSNKNPVSNLLCAWDLDNTLIDSTHRTRIDDNGLFDLDFWIENTTPQMIAKDKLLPLADLFWELRKTDFVQMCVTARKLTEADFDFLKKNGLIFDVILYRKDSEELDHVMKDEQLRSYFNNVGYLPLLAFDDKESNLAVFDKYGFRTFQALYVNEKLRRGDFDSLQGLMPGEFS